MYLPNLCLEKLNFNQYDLSVENIAQKYDYKRFKCLFKEYDIYIEEKELEGIYLQTLDDLYYLAIDCLINFDKLLERIDLFEKNFEDLTSEVEKRQLHISRYVIEDQKKDIVLSKDKIQMFKKELIKLIIENKNEYSLVEFEDRLFDYLYIHRYLLSYLASTTTRLEWQSVSLESSKRVEAFLSRDFDYKGFIGYKRINYPGLKEFEKWFLNEFVDSDYKDDLKCLMTNSGQGAFILLKEMICNQLIKNDSKIMLSKHGYYETRWLISEIKGHTVVYFNDTETDNIISEIKKEKPSFVLLEPIYCDEVIRMIDIYKILEELDKSFLENDMYIVIDASMLSGVVQPFRMKNNNNKLHIFLMESSIKYRQYGMDKVNAGFVIGNKKYLRGMITARGATGATLHNIDLETLPRISRIQHDNRMKIVTRNAKYISKELQIFADNKKNLLLKGVDYPGLESHKDFSIFKKYPYLNGIINFNFDNDYYKNFATMLYVIRKTIESAKEKSISINHGTSFGFDWTRIAVADSSGGNFANPFIRISVGRETMKDIFIITEIVKKVVSEHLEY